MRIGHGYDVHAFCENRPFILGGVNIPYEKGLLGHSDADVLIHSICDALLGAAALGDIGSHFPDNDETYKGICSLLLLKKVGEMLIQEGYTIENIDATVVAEKPKLLPFIKNMRVNIGKCLNICENCISIKATTQEGLGFVGKKEGVAAFAVCLINNEKIL